MQRLLISESHDDNAMATTAAANLWWQLCDSISSQNCTTDEQCNASESWSKSSQSKIASMRKFRGKLGDSEELKSFEGRISCSNLKVNLIDNAIGWAERRMRCVTLRYEQLYKWTGEHECAGMLSGLGDLVHCPMYIYFRNAWIWLRSKCTLLTDVNQVRRCCSTKQAART